MYNITLHKTPKRLIVNFLPSIIGSLNDIKRYKDKRYPHYYLDFQNFKDIDLVGVLVLYKYLDYAVVNRCFYNPQLNQFNATMQAIKRYGFSDLIAKCFGDEKKAIELFSKLKVEIKDSFIIAPITFSSDNSNNNYSERQTYNQLLEYYDNDDVAVMIFSVFGELVSNFYAHANDKTRSIIVGYGNKDYIEIACADSGEGIVNTLKQQYVLANDLRYLEYSLRQNVTSKPDSNHMGCGLWQINQLVKLNEGRMIIYTGSSYYYQSAGKTQFSIVPEWEGTIVYVKLNLRNPVKLSQIIA